MASGLKLRVLTFYFIDPFFRKSLYDATDAALLQVIEYLEKYLESIVSIFRFFWGHFG